MRTNYNLVGGPAGNGSYDAVLCPFMLEWFYRRAFGFTPRDDPLNLREKPVGSILSPSGIVESRVELGESRQLVLHIIPAKLRNETVNSVGLV